MASLESAIRFSDFLGGRADLPEGQPHISASQCEDFLFLRQPLRLVSTSSLKYDLLDVQCGTRRRHCRERGIPGWQRRRVLGGLQMALERSPNSCDSADPSASFVARYGGRLLGGVGEESGAASADAPEDTARFRGEPETMFGRSYGAALLRAVVPATLNGMNHGYEFGVASAVIQNLRHHGPTWGHELKGKQLGTFLSTYFLGEVSAGVAAYLVGDRLGSRELLIIAGLHHLFGGIVYFMAPNLPALLLARFIHGAGTGLGLIAAPQYIAEISPAEVRGAMVSFKETMIMVGLGTGSITGVGLVQVENGWHWMPALGTVPLALLQIAGMLLLSPQSPRRLIQLGRPDDAREVLHGLRPLIAREALDDELQEVTELIRPQEEGEAAGIMQMVADPRLKRLVLTGWAVAFSQSLTGHPTLQVLATKTFHQVGIASSLHAQAATASFMLIKVAFAFVAMDMTDKLGRRPMLLRGVCCMGLSYALLGSACLVTEGSGARLVLGASGMFLNAISYQLSIGPLTWVINSEIYPAYCRANAIAISLLVSYAGNAAASWSIPVLEESAGLSAAFWSLALVCVTAVFVSHRLVFESKGLSLEQIERMSLEDIDARAQGGLFLERAPLEEDPGEQNSPQDADAYRERGRRNNSGDGARGSEEP